MLFFMIYLKIPFLSGFTRKENESLINLFDEFIRGKQIKIHLDVGCGFSPLSFGITDITNIAVDWSKKSIAFASEKNHDWHFIVGDADNIPIKPESIDLVSAIGLSEYISEPVKLLTELINLLRPGGFLIFTSSPPNILNNLRKLWNPGLNLRSGDFWKDCAEKLNFTVIADRNLPMQDQFVLRKSDVI